MAKRNRLELKPYRTKDGEVVWQIYGTVNGIRVRESSGTGDKREAETKRAERELELLQNKPVDKSFGNRTFAFAAAEYMERGGRDGRGGEARFLGPIIKHFGPTRKLAEILPGDIRDMAIELYKDANNKTRNRQGIIPAQAVINYAAGRGWCHYVKVKKFPESTVLRTNVDEAWVDKFRAHCDHPGVKAMARVMFETGARRGSCLIMTRESLNVAACTLTVPTTKNGDPHEFMITPETAKELHALPYIGGNLFGISYPEQIYKIYHETCEKAGIPYVPPHQSGRHSYATHMVTELGVDPATAASNGGWKSLSLFMGTYVHSGKKQRRAAVDKLRKKGSKE